MSKIKEVDIKEIRSMVAEEFRHDPALQQVHIARKIIAKEAESRGLSFLRYIMSLSKEKKGKV